MSHYSDAERYLKKAHDHIGSPETGRALDVASAYAALAQTEALLLIAERLEMIQRSLMHLR